MSQSRLLSSVAQPLTLLLLAVSLHAELLPEGLRLVTCHLGAGASLAAVLHGRSVDTTMGFTPLEGLVMATRSGSVDPGLVLWLQEHAGMPAAELASTLEHRSGLLGLAGRGDMRAILASEERGDPDAGLALDVYVHRLRAAIAAMAASMNGMDGLVFTGGGRRKRPSGEEAGRPRNSASLVSNWTANATQTLTPTSRSAVTTPAFARW